MVIVGLGVILLPTSFFAASKRDIIFPFVLDRFEDGDIRYNPEWFTFGNLAVTAVPAVPENEKAPKKHVSWWAATISWIKESQRPKAFGPSSVLVVDPVNGRYVLKMEGLGKDWFVGGVGTYLGITADNFSFFYLRIRGFGPQSGRLQIELFDDDNQNFKLEQNAKSHYEPMFDDKFVYLIDVTWAGWKDVLIPLNRFRDMNSSVGNNVMDFNQNGASGGLLQVQLVGLTPDGKPIGRFSVEVDSIEFR